MYSELHARTAFSFLDGASQPAELVARAKKLELPAIAITDVNGVYGIVEARDALLELCGTRKPDDEPQAAPRLLYGSELNFDDDVAVALALTREGYANVSQTITTGRLAAPKGEFRLTTDQLCERPVEVLLLAGGPRSAILRLLSEGNLREASLRLSRLREAFGDRLYVELVRHLSPGDMERSLAMAALARRLGLPIVATNDVHFHLRKLKPLHDVLRCIQQGVTLLDAGRRLLPNAEAHLKTPGQMEALFADLPEAIERTSEVVQRVSFHLRDVRYEAPAPNLPPGVAPDAHLEQLCRIGIVERLGTQAPGFIAQLEHELRVVAQLKYAGYFLTMREIVETCHEKGILCQGRGSAANSIICYSLGITSVPPNVIPMLFERFLSTNRAEPPDIDLDIEHERREEILQHVYAKYSRNNAGMVAEIIRFRGRSSRREVGKVFGFPEEQLARLAKLLARSPEGINARVLTAAGIDPANPMLRRFLRCCRAMEGLPRHLSIHVGGFILSDEPLARSVPIENGRMPDRTVLQWAKDDVDSMGMFKLDLLGLGMLTVISKAFALIQKHRGRALTLQSIPEEDPATYAMLQQADSIGVFQVESRAQINMLSRLKPAKLYDLIIEVAIVRPGPIQGDMVHPYLKRRDGREKVDYPHPSLEPILERTLGIPLFQEQVMLLASTVGGYTPGEADQLRRDMASWKNSGNMERHKTKLMAGMQKNGLKPEFVDRVYKQILGFGSYGFPEAHAAAWGQLAYVTAYLKCHFAAEFACALLNSQPMGFYSPAVIINDARRHSVEIRPIDVQRSERDCTVEEGALRLGLRLVRGLPEEKGRAIATARAEGPFESVEELAHRAGLVRRQTVALAAAGALSSLHADRRHAIWAASSHSPGPLFDGWLAPEQATALPALDPLEELQLDITWGSAFPGSHPLALVREPLRAQGISTTKELKEAEKTGRPCQCAGLVITRQMPGDKGILFITLEDETGHMDVVVLPEVQARFHEVVRMHPALVVRGKLVGGNARNIVAAHLEPLAFKQLPAGPSHDFR